MHMAAAEMLSPPPFASAVPSFCSVSSLLSIKASFACSALQILVHFLCQDQIFITVSEGGMCGEHGGIYRVDQITLLEAGSFRVCLVWFCGPLFPVCFLIGSCWKWWFCFLQDATLNKSFIPS